MYDHDVFAVLTASDERNVASSAFKLKENATWFRLATGGVDEWPTIDSRESTPEEGQETEENVGAGNRLVLTFDGLLQTNLSDGVQFGTDPNACHVVLGHRGIPGVSRRQFNITVDRQLRIWLHDSSQYGTSVGYDHQCEGERRRNQTWILSNEPGSANLFQSTTIHSGHLAVRIEFPNHGDKNLRYIDNLQKFVTQAEQAVLTAAGVSLGTGPATAAPSQAETPKKRPIYYRSKFIGGGTFGEVYKAVRVFDGELCAAKIFRKQPQGNKRKRDEMDTENMRKMKMEFEIMKNHPHPNIARVFEFRDTDQPVLFMDYYPEGNINSIKNFSEDMSLTAMGQLLDGLRHLHGNRVAHRDLKPENVLVTQKPVLKFVITDFGLAKIATESTLLRTFCGTQNYMAPEIFPSVSDKHSLVVDIWSLGVMIFEKLYGIPEPPTKPKEKTEGNFVIKEQWGPWIEAWSKSLLNRLESQKDDLVVDILRKMIEYDPEKRWGADACLTRGIDNNVFKRKAIDNVDLVFGFNYNEAVLPATREDGRTTPTPTPHFTIHSGSAMEIATSSLGQHPCYIPASAAQSSQSDGQSQSQIDLKTLVEEKL